MRNQLERLAQHYLQGDPVDLPKATITEFCDWIMAEFQQLPLAIDAADDRPYENAAAMFADIEQDHLWESLDSYDSAFYPNPFYGLALAAIHDYDHYLCQSDFSLVGEMTAYKAAAQRVPNLEMQKILYSEIVLKSAAHLYLGHSPPSKVVFL